MVDFWTHWQARVGHQAAWWKIIRRQAARYFHDRLGVPRGRRHFRRLRDAGMTVTTGPSAQAVIRAWAGQAQRGVIFDFNGTLSDDEPILLEIFTELFAARLGWRMTAEQYYGRLA